MSENLQQFNKLLESLGENHPILDTSVKPREPHGSEVRHYEPAELTPMHKEILRRLSLGFTRKEVATQLGCTPATVTYVKYSRDGQIMLKELGMTRDQMVIGLQKRVSDLGPLAADVVEDALQSEDASLAVKTRVALDILQMNGISKTPVEDKNKHITDSIIEQIKADANASGLMVFAENEIEEAEIVDEATEPNEETTS